MKSKNRRRGPIVKKPPHRKRASSAPRTRKPIARRSRADVDGVAAPTQSTLRRFAAKNAASGGVKSIVRHALPSPSATRRKSVSDPRSLLHLAAPALTAGTLGVVLAAVMRSAAIQTGELFVPSGSPHPALAGMLSALALGVSIPRGFSAWMARTAWQRVAGERQLGSLPGPPPFGDDRSLRWLVLAMLALVVGALTLALPLLVRGAAYGYALAHSRFVWSDVPLTLLQALTVAAATALPLGLLGMTIACAHHTFDRVGAWEPRATGVLLAGVAAGTWMVDAIATLDVDATPVTLLGALAAFLVALVAGLATGIKSAADAVQSPGERLPQWSDRRPRRLRTGILILGLLGACGLMLAGGTQRVGASSPMSPLLLLSAAAYLAGCMIQRRTVGSVAGFGVVTIVAAGTTAIAAALAASSNDSSATAVVASSLCIAAASFATGFGWTALLSRVAVTSSDGSRMATRLLAASAIGALCWVPLFTSRTIEPEPLLVLSLIQSITGSLLIANDPSTRFRGRRAAPRASAVTC